MDNIKIIFLMLQIIFDITVIVYIINRKRKRR